MLFTKPEIVQHCSPKNRFLEDYLSIFPDLENLSQPWFKERYRETLQPLITIAGNNGFVGMQYEVELFKSIF